MEDELYFAKHAFNLKIFNFILMQNHFHMIVQAPNANLSEAMSFFQSQTAQRIVKDQGRINHLWAHRFKRCKLLSDHYFQNTYKYIYQNPIRANVVDSVFEYPYSTLIGLIGKSKLVIPIEYDSIFFSLHHSRYFEWVNTPPPREWQEAVKKALRRSEFKLPRTRMKPTILPAEIP